MSKQGFRGRFLRFAAAVCMGGSIFQVGGCDPEVRAALLDGLEATTGSLTDTIISAFFISLEDEPGTGTGGLTTTQNP